MTNNIKDRSVFHNLFQLNLIFKYLRFLLALGGDDMNKNEIRPTKYGGECA